MKKHVRTEIDRHCGEWSLQGRVWDAILQFAICEIPHRLVFRAGLISPMFMSSTKDEITHALYWLSSGPVQVLDVDPDGNFMVRDEPLFT